MNRFEIGIALAVAIAWFVPQLAADQDKRPRPLPREIVSAWDKAGANLYWARPGRFVQPDLHDIGEGQEGDLPTFQLEVWEAGVLSKMPQPDRGFGLALFSRKITDAGLKELSGLKHLQGLDLSATPVTDAGLKELTRLKELHTLDLYDTAVTDAGLKELIALKQLRSLGLSHTRVTDEGIKALAKLKSLQVLNLSGTRVTDTGLKELAKLKELQALDLSSRHLTEAGLKELVQIDRLRALNLYEARRMTDPDLKVLSGLKQLEWLDLGFPQVTAAGLKQLAGLKRLHTLRMNGTELIGTRLKEFVGAAERRITALQCERLIAQLVNPDKPPFDKPFVLDLPNGVKERTLLNKQAKIAEAYRSLSDNIEVSLPILAKHAEDKRFSYVYEQPISGVYRSAAVGEACRDIIESHVEVYHRYTRKRRDDEGRSNSLWFLAKYGGIEKWWNSRKDKTLAELQLEGIEWVLGHDKPGYFKTEKEWAAAKKSLREMAEAIRASKTPLVVTHRLYFFSK